MDGWARVKPVARRISVVMVAVVSSDLSRLFHVSGLVGTLWRTKWVFQLLL